MLIWFSVILPIGKISLRFKVCFCDCTEAAYWHSNKHNIMDRVFLEQGETWKTQEKIMTNLWIPDFQNPVKLATFRKGLLRLGMHFPGKPYAACFRLTREKQKQKYKVVQTHYQSTWVPGSSSHSSEYHGIPMWNGSTFSADGWAEAWRTFWTYPWQRRSGKRHVPSRSTGT